MSDSSYLVFERSLYWGGHLRSILYGIEIYMFLHSVLLYFAQPVWNRRAQRLYIVIGGLIFFLVSIMFMTESIFLEFTWIVHRNVPGGPLAYHIGSSSVWWRTMGILASELANHLGDGLLIYRTFIIWGTKHAIIIFPCLLILGSITMAIFTTVQSAIPGNDFYHDPVVKFGVSYVALSVASNVFCTTSIIFRILQTREMMRDAGGQPSSALSTAISILVESSLPFSILGIISVVVYGNGISVAPLFVFPWAMLSALSPQLIIFRVALGRAIVPVTHDSVVSLLEFGKAQAPMHDASKEHAATLATPLRVEDRRYSCPGSQNARDSTNC